jgi:hypothetical protein
MNTLANPSQTPPMFSKVFKIDFVEWKSYVMQISEAREQKSTQLDLKVLKVSGHFREDCNICKGFDNPRKWT